MPSCVTSPWKGEKGWYAVWSLVKWSCWFVAPVVVVLLARRFVEAALVLKFLGRLSCRCLLEGLSSRLQAGLLGGWKSLVRQSFSLAWWAGELHLSSRRSEEKEKEERGNWVYIGSSSKLLKTAACPDKNQEKRPHFSCISFATLASG